MILKCWAAVLKWLCSLSTGTILHWQSSVARKFEKLLASWAKLANAARHDREKISLFLIHCKPLLAPQKLNRHDWLQLRMNFDTEESPAYFFPEDALLSTIFFTQTAEK